MNKWIKIFLGLILVILVLMLATPGMPLASWGLAAWTLIKGGLTILVAIIGIMLIVLGISDLKD
ncbi:hypothetical protein HOD29_00345 [archaeon]|jgi:hypothetical protein|nr:hypothetical protein [archaeon]